MPSSAIHTLRYPAGTDAPDVPLDMSRLVADLEAELGTRVAAGAVGDVGQVGQRRAGRVLTANDFTDLGLSLPQVLYNLSNLNDSSGSARNLSNKGAVPFGVGILGAAGEAAVFAGSTAQALYRADEAALSILQGSFGCWFRTGKRGTVQTLLNKQLAAGGQRSYSLGIGSSNFIEGYVSIDGATWVPVTVAAGTDVCDDKWHFAVVTYDGTLLRVYVDGVLEFQAAAAGTIFDGTAPLNLGASGGDAGTASVFPFYGRIDEAFITSDVLNEDQIRCLMAAKIAHGSTRSPRKINLNVRRFRKGALLTQADFTALGLAAPLRIYNLDDLNDDGSAGLNLATGGGGNAAGNVPGPAGKAALGSHFDGVDDYLQVADTALPAAFASRTLMAWFKTTTVANRVIWNYGANVAGQFIRLQTDASGNISITDGTTALAGPFVADGQWHHVALVMDNSATDGVKRKIYLDGKLVAGDTTFASTTLGGVNQLRIGASQAALLVWLGQIARIAVGAYAMTPEQVAAIYAKGALDLGRSPLAAGEYVERLDDTNLYVVGDRATLFDQEQVELEVAA